MKVYTISEVKLSLVLNPIELIHRELVEAGFDRKQPIRRMHDIVKHEYIFTQEEAKPVKE